MGKKDNQATITFTREQNKFMMFYFSPVIYFKHFYELGGEIRDSPRRLGGPEARMGRRARQQSAVSRPAGEYKV